ncbi:MAG: hypothetical protein K2N66_06480, partial [Paramuribaculum sp.]|nr:hypothetical protein [Paramuribaculum sp.]
GGKRCGVCHVDAEKEQQSLAAGVACRYPANAVVLFLIAEAASIAVERRVPIIRRAVLVSAFSSLGFGPLRKTGRYAVFGAIPPVVVVGIDGVCSDFGHFGAGQSC